MPTIQKLSATAKAMSVALGGAAVAVSGANAAVMQGTGGTLTVTLDGVSDQVNWDIDGDGARDFVLWENNEGVLITLFVNLADWITTTSRFSVTPGPVNGSGIVAPSAFNAGIDKLASSIRVGPTLASGAFAQGYQFRTVIQKIQSSTGGGGTTTFSSARNGFEDGGNLIGLRFAISSNTHYA